MAIKPEIEKNNEIRVKLQKIATKIGKLTLLLDLTWVCLANFEEFEPEPTRGRGRRASTTP